jgi:hypothetical protein
VALLITAWKVLSDIKLRAEYDVTNQTDYSTGDDFKFTNKLLINEMRIENEHFVCICDQCGEELTIHISFVLVKP